MKSFLFLVVIAFCAAACCPRNDEVKQKKPGKKPVVRETIDGFTGKTAVDNLKRAKPKINAANETEKQKRGDVDELTKP